MSSISADVVEMVIWSVLASPREIGIGRTSPRISAIATTIRMKRCPPQPAQGGWCAQTTPAASDPGRC